MVFCFSGVGAESDAMTIACPGTRTTKHTRRKITPLNSKPTSDNIPTMKNLISKTACFYPTAIYLLALATTKFPLTITVVLTAVSIFVLLGILEIVNQRSNTIEARQYSMLHAKNKIASLIGVILLHNVIPIWVLSSIG
jgi:hypothetical protein